MEPRPHINWKLPEVLQREGVSIYRLDQELSKRVSRSTLYKWGGEPGPKQIDPEVMGWILWGLARITGKRYEFQDLVDIEPPDIHLDDGYQLDPESKAWLEADLTEPLPPYDWGPEGEPEGQRVIYSVEQGLLVIKDSKV